MGAGDFAFVVEKGGDAFGGAAVVGEHDGRAMFADEVAQQAVNRRPDRSFWQRAERLHGIEDAQIEVLAQSGVYNGDGPRNKPPFGVRLRAAEETSHFIKRP